MSPRLFGARRRPEELGSAFVLGLEQECMTVVRHGPRAALDGLFPRLFRRLRQRAPTLRGASGIFNPYGRIYVDTGQHLELASMECDSPFLLAQVVEQQQRLIADCLAEEQDTAPSLLLANNNHSGLLAPGAPTWGAHENYLVEQHPQELARAMLPFLVTRQYAGAGGVEHPSGRFLAAVRPLFMRGDVGGTTTHDRAVFSLGREEHHMGPSPGRFRLHLILGDGLRSQFALALTFGATALALKAVQVDGKLRRYLGTLKTSPVGDSWTVALRRFNVLAQPGELPRADPLTLEIQRVYLEGAQRYAQSLAEPPAWIERTLRDWSDTLDALGRGDLAWLGARLDAFIKHRLFTDVLRAAGRGWEELPSSPHLFHELALVDQAYHAFTSADSPFALLDGAGLLHQRVADHVAPGAEPEPFVPKTTTRARARARFLVRHGGDPTLMMDWSSVSQARQVEFRTLSDPFARIYSTTERVKRARLESELEQLLRTARAARAAGEE